MSLTQAQIQHEKIFKSMAGKDPKMAAHQEAREPFRGQVKEIMRKSGFHFSIEGDAVISIMSPEIQITYRDFKWSIIVSGQELANLGDGIVISSAPDGAPRINLVLQSEKIGVINGLPEEKQEE